MSLKSVDNNLFPSYFFWQHKFYLFTCITCCWGVVIQWAVLAELTNTRAHTQLRLYWNKVGQMAGLSGMQLNTVIRFEGQFYWLQWWRLRGGGCRRLERVCLSLRGGDNTRTLSVDTNHDGHTWKGGERGRNRLSWEERVWKQNTKEEKDEKRLKEARGPCTKSSKDVFVYYAYGVLRSPFPKSK